MIQGLDLPDLGNLIRDQKARGWDVIAPTGLLTVSTTIENDTLVPHLQFTHNGEGQVSTTISKYALRQLGSWEKVDAKYIDRMSQPKHQDLFEHTLNHWIRDLSEKRLLRFFRGLGSGSDVAMLRAWLSDTFKCIDNYDLAEQLLPLIHERGYAVKSAQITEKRLYMQIVDEAIKQEMDLTVGGHTIKRCFSPGAVISNSEVGAGSCNIEEMMWDKYCTNGSIWGSLLRRNHVGRRNGGDDDSIDDLLSDETKSVNDLAFWMRVKDVTIAAFDHARFESKVAKIANASEITVPALPDKIVDVVRERLNLNEAERDAAFQHLFEGGDTSLFGIYNAVTRTAQDASNYDRAIELERDGTGILSWDAASVMRDAERIVREAKKGGRNG